MIFSLHPALASKPFLLELTLCTVLLENEIHYPWLILVPRRADKKMLMDLSFNDQILLLKEVDLCQRVVQDLYAPDQINIAALGNKTPQLHVHVIGRFTNDPAWPQAVWDHPTKKGYFNADLFLKQKEIIKAFYQILSSAEKNPCYPSDEAVQSKLFS